MAKTVSATLKLFDSFSGTLDKVTGNMNKAAAKMSGFRDQLEKPIAGGGGMFKSMLGAQLAGNVISKGMGVAQGAISELMGGLDESSKAWQTFNGNMEQLQMPTDQIAGAKKDMQDFAQKTIYSASDMASTYSQLAAVGIKNTGQLVKGFGGLAAASTEPTQAMKTLSQQATQMAAKPMVQWADFKLMLEQTPAGIAATAKTMGRSTGQLVKDVQDGKVKTQEFFDAISKTGTNANFTKMATQFKTVGQAVDGLKENLVNGLQGAYDSVSKKGIAFISSLADGVSKIDFGAIFDKGFSIIENGFNKAKAVVTAFWKDFTATGAVSEVEDAFQAVWWALQSLYKAFGGALGSMTGDSQSFGTIAGNAIKKVAQFIEFLTRFINQLQPDQLKAVAKNVIGLAAGFMGFKGAVKIIGSVGDAMSGLTKTFDAFAKHPILSTIALLVGAFVTAYTTIPKFRAAVNKAAGAIVAFLKGLNPTELKIIGGAIAGVVGGLALLSKLKIGNPLAPLTQAAGKGNPLQSIADGFGALQKSAGIALVISSIALLAYALQGIATAGAQAVPNLITFGAVVGGLAAVFAIAGSSLQGSAIGIAVFSAAVSLLAFSMTGIANAGTGAVANMATFGIVIGGLVVVFAVFGGALTAAIPAMLAFGAAILMAGIGIGAAAPGIAALATLVQALGVAISMVAITIGVAVTQIVTAIGTQLVNVMKQAGDTISQVVDTIGTNISKVATALGDMAGKIGGGIKSVLDGIADVFQSIGNAALHAGQGFRDLAQGVQMLSDVGIMRTGAILTAVAGGISAVTAVSGGLASAGQGLLQMAIGAGMLVGSGLTLAAILPIVATALSLIAPVAPAAGQGFMIIGSGSVVAAAGMSALSSSMLLVVAALTILSSLVVTFASTANAAFDSFANKVKSAMSQVVSTVQSGMSSAVAAVNAQSGVLESAGENFVQGFINGIKSQIGAAASAAASMAEAASSAAQKNLKIKSPSRVMHDTVGKFFTLGFAKGITDYTPTAQRASSDMTSATVSSSNAGAALTAATGTGSTDNSQTNATTVQIGAGAFEIALPDSTPESIERMIRAFEKYFVELDNGALQYE